MGTHASLHPSPASGTTCAGAPRRPRPAGRRCGLRPVLVVAVLAGALLAGQVALAQLAAAAPDPPAPSPAPPTPTAPVVTPPVPPPAVEMPPVVPSVPVPVGTDAPAPVPAPPDDPLDPLDSGSGQDDPHWWDVEGKVRKAIDDWFRDLVSSAATALLDVLGKTVLATPDPEAQPRVRDLWSTSAVVANTCFVLLVVVGGLLVMGHQTVQTHTSAKQVAPRLVAAFVAANASLGIAGQAVRLTNALAQAFTGQGVQVGQGVTWSKLVIVPVAGDAVFLVLLCLVVVALAAVLVVTCIVRAAVVLLLSAAGPLALACHALPQTEPLAALWWRALAGALGVQLAQAFTLVTALRVFLVSDGNPAAGLSVGGRLVNVLVAVCLLWVCIRIPAWVRHLVFSRSSHRTVLGTVVRTLVAAKTLGLARSALAGRFARNTSAAGRRPAGGGPRRGPGGPSRPRGPRGPGGGPRPGGPPAAGSRLPRRPTPRTSSGAAAAATPSRPLPAP